eukprot:PITA_25780
MITIVQFDPGTFKDVVKHQVWNDAMNKEYESIMKNDVWDVVPRSKEKYVITSKWLYKIKHGANASDEKYKARFVAQGFSQKEGVDYDEIFSPVSRYTTIRSVIALASLQGWNLHQMDVKIGFLHGSIKEEFYVENEIPLILVLYVDDLFLIGVNPLIHQCKKELAFEFEMRDLGLMHYFLGLEVWQKQGDIFLSQGKYIMKLLEIFGMVDCKSVTTPMELNFKKLCRSVIGPDLGNHFEYHQLMGALMFLVNYHLDICFAVNTLSQFMVEPHHSHWIDAKNLLRYLQGTITYRLRYTAENVRLHGYSNAHWVGNVVDRKSTSGCCFSLGYASISYMSRKQKSIALSTGELDTLLLVWPAVKLFG